MVEIQISIHGKGLMMRRFFKRFIVFLLFSGILFAESVEVRVNSTRVTPGERLEVKIIAVGKDVNFPKIESVDGVVVENTKVFSKFQTQIINNKITQRNEKIVSFNLYPDKNITIPEFEVEIDGQKYKTKPVNIEVTKAKQSSSPATQFELKTYVDKKIVYLGEPIIFTVDAIEPSSSGATVSQMNYIAPEFKNFFVKQLGGEQRVQENGKTVHRLKYLLTPQKAGTILIPPAGLKIGVEDLNAPADPFGLFGSPVKWYTMRSKPIRIEVKESPKDVNLIGNFEVLAKVDKQKVRANEPVNYVLTIKGEGNLEDLEDPVFDIAGVTVYSDNPVVKSKIDGDKLYSIYLKKYVFISDSSFTIPEVVFKEFDYTTNTRKEIKTPSFDILINGTPVARNNLSSGAGVANPNPFGGKSGIENNSSILEDSVYYAKKEYEEKSAMLPFYIFVSFLAGMMAMFAIMKLFKKSKRVRNLISKEKQVLKNYTTKEALDLLYPHTSDSPEVESMVKNLYLVLKGRRALHTIDKDKLNKMIEIYEKSQR